jgi:hypothetical protein
MPCGKTSFGKAKLGVGWGVAVSNMTSQSNENDDLSPRKCPKLHYDAPCKCFVTYQRKPGRLKPEFMCIP